MPSYNSNSSVLTPEEKKYMRSICRYLGSLGMKSGLVEIPIEGDFDKDDSIKTLERIDSFENNYSAFIPNDLLEIFKKIIIHIEDNNLFSEADVDDVSYERLEIEISCPTQELTVSHYYSYYEVSETHEDRFTSEDYEELNGIFETLSNETDDNILKIYYNGSGDSGYIEDNFDGTQIEVPVPLQDFCYNRLESLFGGWEINEGSQGRFEVDMEDKSVTLYHQSNIEESESNTIFEEKFELK